MQILICEVPIHCCIAASKSRNSGCSINSPVTKEHPENKKHMQKIALTVAAVCIFDVTFATIYSLPF